MAAGLARSGYYHCVAKRMKAEAVPAIKYDSFILKQLSQFLCRCFFFSHYEPPLCGDLIDIRTSCPVQRGLVNSIKRYYPAMTD